MKKIALAVIATAFLAIGHAPVSAQQLPAECESGEFDGTEQECIEFYTDEAVVVLPPATTVVQQGGTLPQSGSSVSPILGVGALLFVGGGIVLVASRRRSASPAI